MFLTGLSSSTYEALSTITDGTVVAIEKLRPFDKDELQLLIKEIEPSKYL